MNNIEFIKEIGKGYGVVELSSEVNAKATSIEGALDYLIKNLYLNRDKLDRDSFEWSDSFFRGKFVARLHKLGKEDKLIYATFYYDLISGNIIKNFAKGKGVDWNARVGSYYVKPDMDTLNNLTAFKDELVFCGSVDISNSAMFVQTLYAYLGSDSSDIVMSDTRVAETHTFKRAESCPAITLGIKQAYYPKKFYKDKDLKFFYARDNDRIYLSSGKGILIDYYVNNVEGSKFLLEYTDKESANTLSFKLDKGSIGLLGVVARCIRVYYNAKYKQVVLYGVDDDEEASVILDAEAKGEAFDILDKDSNAFEFICCLNNTTFGKELNIEIGFDEFNQLRRPLIVNGAKTLAVSLYDEGRVSIENNEWIETIEADLAMQNAGATEDKVEVKEIVNNNMEDTKMETKKIKAVNVENDINAINKAKDKQRTINNRLNKALAFYAIGLDEQGARDYMARMIEAFPTYKVAPTASLVFNPIRAEYIKLSNEDKEKAMDIAGIMWEMQENYAKDLEEALDSDSFIKKNAKNEGDALELFNIVSKAITYIELNTKSPELEAKINAFIDSTLKGLSDTTFDMSAKECVNHKTNKKIESIKADTTLEDNYKAIAIKLLGKLNDMVATLCDTKAKQFKALDADATIKNVNNAEIVSKAFRGSIRKAMGCVELEIESPELEAKVDSFISGMLKGINRIYLSPHTSKPILDYYDTRLRYIEVDEWYDDTTRDKAIKLLARLKNMVVRLCYTENDIRDYNLITKKFVNKKSNTEIIVEVDNNQGVNKTTPQGEVGRVNCNKNNNLNKLKQSLKNNNFINNFINKLEVGAIAMLNKKIGRQRLAYATI